jgi:chromosome segregation ATPase
MKSVSGLKNPANERTVEVQGSNKHKRQALDGSNVHAVKTLPRAEDRAGLSSRASLGYIPRSVVLENQSNDEPKKDIPRHGSAPPRTSRNIPEARPQEPSRNRTERQPRDATNQHLEPPRELHEDQIRQAQDEKNALTKRISELESTIREHKKRQRDQRYELEQRFQALHNEWKNATDVLVGERNRAQYLQTQLMESQQEVSFLQERLNSLRKAKDAREKAFRVRNGNFEDVEKMKALEKELDTTLSENKVMKAKIEELTFDNKDMTSETKALNATLASSQEKVQDLKEEVIQLKALHGRELEVAKENSRLEISALSADLQNVIQGLDRRLSVQEKELQDARTQIQRQKEESHRASFEAKLKHDKVHEQKANVEEELQACLRKHDFQRESWRKSMEKQMADFEAEMIEVVKQREEDKKKISQIQKRLLDSMTEKIQIMDGELRFVDESSSYVRELASQLVSKSKELSRQHGATLENKKADLIRQMSSLKNDFKSE